MFKLQNILALLMIISVVSATGNATFNLINSAGSPLAGIDVTLSQGIPLYTITSVAGYSNFTDIVAGIYNYSAAATGYVTKNGTITIVDDQTVPQINIIMTATSELPGTFELCLQTSDSRTISANVALNRNPNNFYYTVSVQGCNSWSLPSGTYTISVQASGYTTYTQAGIALPANGFVTTSTTLQNDGSKNATLIFNITNESGTGIASRINLNGVNYDTTNGQRTFSLAASTYNIQVSATGYDGATTSVSLSETETRRLDLTLLSSGVLSLGVYNSSNSLLDGVEAVLVGTNATQLFFDGIVQANLRPGNYQLTVYKAGYMTGTTTVRINASQTTTLNVALLKEEETHTGTLRVRVWDLEGNSGSSAQLIVSGPTSFTTSTSYDGWIPQRTVIAGAYLINVSASEYESVIVAANVAENENKVVNISVRRIGNCNISVEKTTLEAKEKLNVSINTSKASDLILSIIGSNGVIEQSRITIDGSRVIFKGPFSPGRYKLVIEKISLLNGSKIEEYEFNVLEGGVGLNLIASDQKQYESIGCINFGAHQFSLTNQRKINLYVTFSYTSSDENVEIVGNSSVYLGANDTMVRTFGVTKAGNALGSSYVTLTAVDNQSGYESKLLVPICAESGVQLTAEMTSVAKTAARDEKTCQRIIIQNKDDYRGDNVMLSVDGEYDPIIYPEEIYLGPKAIETVDLCISVPQNADGETLNYEVKAYSKKIGSSTSFASFEVPRSLFELNVPTTCLNYDRDSVISHLITVKNLGHKGNYELNINETGGTGVVATLSNYQLYNIDKNEQRSVYVNLLPSSVITAGNHQLTVTLSEDGTAIASKQICISAPAEYDIYTSLEVSEITAKIGETTAIVMKMANIGTTENEYLLSYSGMLKNVYLSPNKVKLSPGESRDISISMIPINATVSGKYILKINIIGTLVTRYREILVNVENKELNAGIAAESEQSGGEMIVKLNVTNNENSTGEFKPMIKNLPENWTYITEPNSATLAPGETKEFVMTITPASDYNPNEEYLLDTEVYSGNKVASNSILVPKMGTGLFLGFGKTNTNMALSLMTITLLLIAIGIVLSYKLKLRGKIIKKP